MKPKTPSELRQFIINELKTKKPSEANPERIADFILSQPSMRSQAGIEGFLKGYLNR